MINTVKSGILWFLKRDSVMLKRLNILNVLILAVMIVLWFLFYRFILLRVTFVDSSLAYYGIAIIIMLFYYYLRSSTEEEMSKKEYTVHLCISAVLFLTGFLFCYTLYKVLTGIILMAVGMIHFFWASADNKTGKFVKNLERSLGFSLMLYIVGILLCLKNIWIYVGIFAAVLGYCSFLNTIKRYRIEKGKLFRIINVLFLICLVAVPMLGVFS